MIFWIICSATIVNALYMANTPPKSWSFLSSNLKKNAREWFIYRAENAGIPWKSSVESYTDYDVFHKIKNHKRVIEDSTIEYPEYYTQPFHGYDYGNLEWKAALEGEVATKSVSVDYWKNVNYSVSCNWLRHNATQNIHRYLRLIHKPIRDIRHILDIGCSIGISTEYLAKYFKHSNLIGIDLSSYFLAVAAYRSEKEGHNIHYMHANAENIPLCDESFDMIAINFVLHEVPFGPRIEILREAYRLLKPEGVLIILDIDPDRISDLDRNPFRKWAFEMTEPHIYDYYKNNVKDSIVGSGFDDVQEIANDPVNTIWMGKKSVLKVHRLHVQPPKQIFTFAT